MGNGDYPRERKRQKMRVDRVSVPEMLPLLR